MTGKPYLSFLSLKRRVSIPVLLKLYGRLHTLTRAESGFRGRCPICGAEQFFTSETFWRCRGCKREGTILDLVAVMQGVSIHEAALLIAEWFGLEEGASARNRSSEGGADGRL